MTAPHSIHISEAKTRLSQLVDQAVAGEDVVVGRHGKPLVRITRLEASKPAIRFGMLKGRVRVAPDFDAPLPTRCWPASRGADAPAAGHTHLPVGRGGRPGLEAGRPQS